MYFPDDRHSTVIILPYNFPAIRVFDTTLSATDLVMKVSCSPPNPGTPLSLEDLEQKSTEGFRRIKFWVDHVLYNCILIDVGAKNFENITSGVSNTVMFTPGQPTDHLLVTLFHSKISAITNGLLDIHAVSIITADTDGIETSFRHNENGYGLPDISYFPAEILHTAPWWTRDTIEVCEFPRVGLNADELFNKFSDYFTAEDSKDSKEADIIIMTKDED